MNCYLFSRKDWPRLSTISPAALATSVFFQMWRTRSFPYNQICEEDVAYIGDTKTREIYWEVRVTNLLTDFGYTSPKHALNGLRSAYGLYAEDLNDYHLARSGRGWLLAWSPKVMRRLTVSLPTGAHFGQNGYRLLNSSECRSMGLPNPRTAKPLADSPRWYDPGAATSGKVRKVPRYIPMHVRDLVIERDRNRCVGCGATTNLHFDHVLPYSHGGPSTFENLRLVCAASNLVRGAGDPQGVLACAPKPS